ncbi:MAG TPA: zf-HC2 domain-containing protein [Pyrinomonadaceae bacterium]|nr:zf-HC2 domain-containing protein [Pyrinomonadaceae bacterium]
MTCEETSRLVSQYVDDAVSLPARVEMEEHLDRCPVCRGEVADLRGLTRSLRQLARPAVPNDLTASISAALQIEAAARRQTPTPSFKERLALWAEPRLMPYGVGAMASVVMFVSMFVALSPHFRALQRVAHGNDAVATASPGFDLNRPVTSEDFSARRAPFAEQSPSLDPKGALAALTSAYAQPQPAADEDVDDMIVVADVFSNGSASLAGVVHAPRNPQMLTDFEVALRQSAAFVPASLDRRPGTMRVVFSVQKVDVRDRSF